LDGYIIQDFIDYVNFAREKIVLSCSSMKKGAVQEVDHTFVGSTSGYKACLTLLKNLQQLKDKGKRQAGLAFLLQLLNRPRADLKYIKILSEKLHGTLNKPSDPDASKIQTALGWLRRVFHTEVQLAVLLVLGGHKLEASSAILSAFEPCASCEQGVPIREWVQTQKVPFLSFNRDKSEHTAEVTGLVLVHIPAQPKTTPDIYVTVSKDSI
jgi:hypothetical protein